MKYYSQYLQDYFIDKFCFKKKENGFFLDIGAYDGVTFSNTYFFEKERAWKGICVEPINSVYEKLISVRTCQCVNGCIAENDGVATFHHLDGPSEMLSGIDSNFDERHLERMNREVHELGGKLIKTEVKTYNVNTILSNQKIDKIDLLSIDAEGSELSILKTIDFNSVKINVLTIENNYKSDDIREILSPFGYSSIGYLCADEIFILGTSRLNFLKTAVFCFSILVKIKNRFK
ncbi:MAG: FkbM family methyltransferase [Bacteroidota bacterium]